MPNHQHCSVVGLVGIIVQISLGILSFSVLILKRHCEFPKRPWKIWSFDTSKQIISQLLAHFINLTISVALTYEDDNSDSCLWYFITNIFDNTLGVFICVMILRKLQKQFMKRNKTYLISGYYYSIKNEENDEIEMQPKNEEENQEKSELTGQDYIINYKSWLLQLGLWNVIVIGAKIVMFALEYMLRDQLDEVSQFLLGWIQEYPNLQLVLVIVVVPVVMNGLAFWVQDNFLKKRNIDQQLKEIQVETQKKQTERQKKQTCSAEQTKNKENIQKSLELKQ